MAEDAPILVPVATLEDAQILHPLWNALARVESRPVLFVHAIDPSAAWHRERTEAARLLTAVEELAQETGIQASTQIVSGVSVGEALREIIRVHTPSLLLLRWSGDTPTRRQASLGDVLDLLLDDPICDVLVVRGRLPSPGPRRILIPTAGGPNVILAARVAHALGQVYQSTLTFLRVYRPGETPPTPEQWAAMLGDLVNAPYVTVHAVEAPGVIQGIVTAATTHDLVLIGATEESIWRRVRMGDVPRRLAATLDRPLGIAKRRAPRRRTWIRRVFAGVDARLPKLTPEERAEVYRHLRESTLASGDFRLRMGLAAFLAALGLLLNSPAVVIGAMLVAPLMSALLAVGLGIVMGDARLVRRALERSLEGGLLVLVISALTAWLDPLATLTGEITARSQPTLLDLSVALASGIAGGYTASRKGVQEALAGVAIAVSLVPPLSVVGIALALQEWQVAAGAALLYAANTVSITGGGGLIFLLLGFRPRLWSRTRLQVFWQGVVGLLLLLIFVGVPLAWLTQRDIAHARVQAAVYRAVHASLTAWPEVTLKDTEWYETDEAIHIVLYVETSAPLTQTQVNALRDRLAQSLGRPVRLRVVQMPVLEAPSPP